MEFTAEMIAGYLGGEIVGDKGAKVTTFAKIEEGHAGALSFLSNPKYEQYIYTTDSSIVVVNRAFEPTGPVKATMVKVDDSYGSFARLLELYTAGKPRPSGISSKADISPEAKLGKDCYVGSFTVIEAGVETGGNAAIYPNCYIGGGVKIGDNVTIYAGVTIYEGCIIGSNVIINAGAVIGADGFGFAPDENGIYHKVPQIGNVVIEDNVEVGANTCIDCATMGSTIVKKGAKLDNLIQIAHNAVIGENSVLAAQVGIAGTSKVGRDCMFGGQAGVAGHLVVGDRVQLASQTGVTHNIPDDSVCIGFPAMPANKYHRSQAVFRNLPEISKIVYRLEKEAKKVEG